MARKTAEERFKVKIRIDADGCHSWTACTLKSGYGWFRSNGESGYAHRWAYENYVGPIPDGYHVDHMCHNKTCVNPEHLRAVTPKQNTENRPTNRTGNMSGYRGVFLVRKIGKWEGVVEHFGRRYRAGYFATPEEANAAIVELRKELHTHNDIDRVPC